MSSASKPMDLRDLGTPDAFAFDRWPTSGSTSWRRVGPSTVQPAGPPQRHRRVEHLQPLLWPTRSTSAWPDPPGARRIHPDGDAVATVTIIADLVLWATTARAGGTCDMTVGDDSHRVT